MKICAYVQEEYAKSNYANECMDTRLFIGLRVIVDSLNKNGYGVEYAGIATVHKYDVVLVSITSDCDWWTFINERVRWVKGNYIVIAGGAGVLHVAPFLSFADYFVLGRGESSVINLLEKLSGKRFAPDESVIESKTFSADNTYFIKQASEVYPHPILLKNENEWTEHHIGCNHKCLFCAYTWQRKNNSKTFIWDAMGDAHMEEKECAMLDYKSGKYKIDFSKIRTTAIDGFSERLRYMMNKKISKETVKQFLTDCINSDAKPHQLKIFNICGYPTETEDDWKEYTETLREVDRNMTAREVQWCALLHTTPFRAMPATPAACMEMSYKNYRGTIGNTLGPQLKGGIIYQGPRLWSVESAGTESLPTVFMSAICLRGAQSDADAIIKISTSSKYKSATTAVKTATLEKYFDAYKMFQRYTAETLPSRYLRTYAKVERMWPTCQKT